MVTAKVTASYVLRHSKLCSYHQNDLLLQRA